MYDFLGNNGLSWVSKVSPIHETETTSSVFAKDGRVFVETKGENGNVISTLSLSPSWAEELADLLKEAAVYAKNQQERAAKGS